IVAAWIKAEIGVGPSIASGNQTCSGNCADLPTAPQKIKSAATVRNAGCADKIDPPSDGFAAANNRGAISVKTIDPVAIQILRMPSMNPKSPIRVAMNALLRDSAAQ